MLYVKIKDDEFGILFKHDRIIKNYVADLKKGLEERKQSHPFMTSCVVFKNEVPIGTGMAKVDSRDRFNYEKGRKTSLSSAIGATELTKEEREELWSGYLNR